MDTPGVTRDRIYGKVEYNNKRFHLIDTGGISLGDDDFQKDILAQSNFSKLMKRFSFVCSKMV